MRGVLRELEAPREPDGLLFDAVRTGDLVELSAGGELLGAFAVAEGAPLGLFAANGEATFTELELR